MVYILQFIGPNTENLLYKEKISGANGLRLDHT